MKLLLENKSTRMDLRTDTITLSAPNAPGADDNIYTIMISHPADPDAVDLDACEV